MRRFYRKKYVKVNFRNGKSEETYLLSTSVVEAVGVVYYVSGGVAILPEDGEVVNLDGTRLDLSDGLPIY